MNMFIGYFKTGGGGGGVRAVEPPEPPELPLDPPLPFNAFLNIILIIILFISTNEELTLVLQIQKQCRKYIIHILICTNLFFF